MFLPFVLSFQILLSISSYAVLGQSGNVTEEQIQYFSALINNSFAQANAYQLKTNLLEYAPTNDGIVGL